MRVELPDGNWAEIKDVDDLTGADEAAVKGAVRFAAVAGKKNATVDAFASASAEMELMMLARVITSWSLPVPVNASNIRNLKRSQLRPLRDAIKPHMLEMADDGEDESPDPNSPAAESPGESGTPTG